MVAFDEGARIEIVERHLGLAAFVEHDGGKRFSH
jgi:hypothetical protein